ncbi:fungal-specific transcription factor domain-containing protein [Aspergillus californicus]
MTPGGNIRIPGITTGPTRHATPSDEPDMTLNQVLLGPLNTELANSPAEWMEWFDFSSLEDQDTRISRHYFVRVCRINSCFDSEINFFRVEVANMMASCPLIYHCVLSMSAAHLTAVKEDMVATALDHRTKAISCLKSEIAHMEDNSVTKNPLEVLLGSVLLGMTDGWHNPAFLGTSHLHEARILFPRWIFAAGKATPSTTYCSPRVRSFICGAMAYWEAMSCFVMNQSLDSIAYLDVICQNPDTPIHYPNPWTGVCTPLFVHLARTGTLARLRSMLRQLASITTSREVHKHMESNLLRSARQTEAALLEYRVPGKDTIEDTADPLTPVKHLQRLAQVYRLSAMIELYRNFPELLAEDCHGQPSSAPTGLTTTGKIVAMATSTLTLIAAIPATSGVNCLLTMPLIIAGSTLQSTQKQQPRELHGATAWDVISAEIVSVSCQADVYSYWRDLVRGRLQAILQYVGIPTISRATEILEKVWTRSDVQAVGDFPGGGHVAPGFVQWIEVMTEEKLEAMYG